MNNADFKAHMPTLKFISGKKKISLPCFNYNYIRCIRGFGFKKQLLFCVNKPGNKKNYKERNGSRRRNQAELAEGFDDVTLQV